MFKRVTLLGLLSFLVLGIGSCAPAPEPEPEPVVEDAISEEEPDFTSQNITVMGVKLGDSTNAVAGNFGDQTGETINGETDYLTVYQEGGIVAYTFKQTGVVRRMEVLTVFSDEVVDPNLKAWLEDGDQTVLREWLGNEESLENVPENNNATEFAYDSRGLRFVQYSFDTGGQYAVRFSQIP